MAEQTTNAESLDRTTAAERLETIATELREGDEFTVSVGNKDINLSPSESIDYRIDVIEKRARFRGSRETVQIELDWKPE